VKPSAARGAAGGGDHGATGGWPTVKPATSTATAASSSDVSTSAAGSGGPGSSPSTKSSTGGAAATAVGSGDGASTSGGSGDSSGAASQGAGDSNGSGPGPGGNKYKYPTMSMADVLSLGRSAPWVKAKPATSPDIVMGGSAVVGSSSSAKKGAASTPSVSLDSLALDEKVQMLGGGDDAEDDGDDADNDNDSDPVAGTTSVADDANGRGDSTTGVIAVGVSTPVTGSTDPDEVVEGA
jgi:hypothetical protein